MDFVSVQSTELGTGKAYGRDAPNVYFPPGGLPQVELYLSCGSLHKHREVRNKAIPVHPWTGPESSRGLSLPDFKTIGT